MFDVSFPRSATLTQVLAATGLSVALVALPVGFGVSGGVFGFAEKVAMAGQHGGSGGGGGGGSGGGGSGGGGSGGGGSGGGDSGSGDSGSSGGGSGQGGGGVAGDAGESRGEGRSASAEERSQEFKDTARERYASALEAGGERGDRADRDVGQAEYRLSEVEVEALANQGWGASRGELGEGFENQGERVGFYQDMAEALDAPSSYGTLWAAFGTANENGLVGLAEAADAAAQAAQAAAGQADAEAARQRAAAAQGALEGAVAAVKPGGGPVNGWETIDLDQNGDGIVNEADLALLQAANGVADISTQ